MPIITNLFQDIFLVLSSGSMQKMCTRIFCGLLANFDGLRIDRLVRKGYFTLNTP